jgi:cytidine kinase
VRKHAVIVGELTLDDVIFEDERCEWKQVGGGALYSAIGTLGWSVRPAISATVGEDYPEQLVAMLEGAGIDLSGITSIQGSSLGLWLLYERSGRRHQVEKSSSSTFDTLDQARKPWPEAYTRPDGLHVAPQSAEGQIAALKQARTFDIPVTQDVLIEPFISIDLYRSGEALRGTTAFLPSQQEVRQIWGDISDGELLRTVREIADVRHLVITRGKLGADVMMEQKRFRVPPCNMRLVDPTGAGDAFSGGFLAGLIDTGDPVESAVRGAVSASIVVETSGALAAIEALDPKVIQGRANELRRKVAAT